MCVSLSKYPNLVESIDSLRLKEQTIMSMYVQKRSGKKESVHFDKITSRISKLCYGLDPKVSFALQRRLPNNECPSLVSSLSLSHTHSRIFLRPLQHVDPVIISQKVIQGVYPGVTTSELDE